MPNSLQIPPYRAALLTGADGAPVIRSNGPDSELVMTERQWYMFWQALAGQLNDHTQGLEGLGNIVTFGNHADRPDPGPWPDGALYVEWDRGSVLYQNQGGVWVYIAGQMFGTLSPDQRPTDLGMPDAGFAFRTNVDPARSFAWSGTAWIETTPIRYGTHAARLAAPIAGLVSGMLWMETDRGSVIYQNQGGVWLFLTGTMWDTMSPDNRPTDLGVLDAGFDYRSTDPPAREFIWNQTAWVEVTALVDPTTTKGDLIARGAAAPATRLPVGSDGQVLVADAAQALGVKWGVPSISGGSLTHANVVTKVGSVAGQIVEGGITDESAANSSTVHIFAAGNVDMATVRSINFVAPTAGAGVELAYTGGAGYVLSFDRAAGTYRPLKVNGAGVDVNGQGTAIALQATGGGNVAVGLFSATYQFQLGTDSAGKPATSTWSVVSDLRLKNNVEPVKDDSLAILDKLDWIRYEYNGLAQMPRGLKGIGLVAQALQAQMPEAVRSNKTKLTETDDAEETDVLAIDYHYVLVHAARAIQQLSAEVKRLGALMEKPA